MGDNPKFQANGQVDLPGIPDLRKGSRNLLVERPVLFGQDGTTFDLKSSLEVDQMLSKGLNMKEICKYLNEMHRSNGIKFTLTNNGTCIQISGPNLQHFFVEDPANPGKLISLSPSLNATTVDQTDTILKALEKKGVGFVTQYAKGWHRFWYLGKNAVFMSYGVGGSLAVLRGAGVESLASVTGAAAFSLNGLMALSFIGGLFVKLIMVYVPDGGVKSGLKLVDKIVSFPTVLALFGVNKLLGTAEQLTLGRAYDLSIPGALGIIDTPIDVSFNQTVANLNSWYKGDLIKDLTDSARERVIEFLQKKGT